MINPVSTHTLCWLCVCVYFSVSVKPKQLHIYKMFAHIVIQCSFSYAVRAFSRYSPQRCPSSPLPMFKLACACALAALASSSRVSYPAASHIPAGWRNEGPSPQDAVVPLMFAMRQRNVDVMMAELDAVSTPTSPSYGKVRLRLIRWLMW